MITMVEMRYTFPMPISMLSDGSQCEIPNHGTGFLEGYLTGLKAVGILHSFKIGYAIKDHFDATLDFVNETAGTRFKVEEALKKIGGKNTTQE